MARAALRLPENVPGDFFVDSTCIDCDACRLLAPSVFRQAGDQSVVYHQPGTAEELLRAQIALVSCPTASIGSVSKSDVTAAIASLPEPVAGEVHRCGFTSESSFGAISYYIRREDGGVLVDSPRFAKPLVRNLEALGGIRRMLLTHRDDVADHRKFRDHFACERVLHRDDVGTQTASVELQPTGTDPVALDRDLLMIPTPGHTRGHAVFLHRDEFLFTGDHLAWNERRRRLYAFRNACWYSWERQIESMERLLDYRFEWVLPGHGRPVHLPAARMREELEKCVAWMRER
ncbi:MAG TPA: MBL fold metallo-hydrolase [Thermoanaerobaculia bacterium]|nr:MBL fold metallo-hydrolase [Thermoanaerobaculia bacterium]